MKLIKLTAIIAATLASSIALADDTKNPVAVSATIGTLGYGASIGWSVNDSTELQAGWMGTAKEHSVDLQKVKNLAKDVGINLVPNLNASTTVKKQSTPFIGVQLRPFSNWLTVGAGVMMPSNVGFDAKFDVKPTPEAKDPNKPITIDTFGATLNYRNSSKLAPYGTIGLRPNINNNWGIFAEAGVAYMGEPSYTFVSAAKFNNNANAAANGKTQGSTPTNTAQAAKAYLDKKLNGEVAQNLQKYQSLYPIAKVGVTYRF